MLKCEQKLLILSILGRNYWSSCRVIFNHVLRTLDSKRKQKYWRGEDDIITVTYCLLVFFKCEIANVVLVDSTIRPQQVTLSFRCNMKECETLVLQYPLQSFMSRHTVPHTSQSQPPHKISNHIDQTQYWSAQIKGQRWLHTWWWKKPPFTRFFIKWSLQLLKPCNSELHYLTVDKYSYYLAQISVQFSDVQHVQYNPDVGIQDGCQDWTETT